jgi:hypothetical protein
MREDCRTLIVEDDEVMTYALLDRICILCDVFG